MTGAGFNKEQIIAKPREEEEGLQAADACRKHRVRTFASLPQRVELRAAGLSNGTPQIASDKWHVFG